MKTTLPTLLALASLPLSSRAQTPLLTTADSVPGVGDVLRVDAFSINDRGEWLLAVRTDHPNPLQDQVVLRDGLLLLREGQPLASPPGATLKAVYPLGLNDEGESVWTFSIAGTSGLLDDTGLYSGTDLLIQEGDFVPSLGGFLLSFQAHQNDEGDVLGGLLVQTGAGYRSAVVRFEVAPGGGIANLETLVESGDVLPHSSLPVAQVALIDANDLGDALFEASGGHLYLGEEELAALGDDAPIPGGRTWIHWYEAHVNDNRDWVVRGKLDGDPHSNELIAKNGVALVQEGEILDGVSLTGFGAGAPTLLANTGEVLWFGGEIDTGSLFVDDRVLVRNGVTRVGGLRITRLYGDVDGFAMSPSGRYVVFKAMLEDGTVGAYLLDRGPIASQSLRNGDRINPVCLSGVTLPVIGTPWITEVDPSANPGATSVLYFATAVPHPGALLPVGELLVDPSNPLVFAQLFPVSAQPVQLATVLPNDPAILGVSIHAQALLAGPGGPRLCNAIRPTAGL